MKKLLLIALSSLWLAGCAGNDEDALRTASEVERTPRIRPDFMDLVIPPNIAPLNFIVDEEGTGYLVRITGAENRVVLVKSTDGAIRIPGRSWKTLAAESRGKELSYEVFVNNHGWKRYHSFRNRVAAEGVDRCMVYRSMPVIYNHYRDIRIMQHDLETGRASPLFAFPSHSPGCLNCHTFLANRPGTFSIQSRHTRFGNATIFADSAGAQAVPVKFGYGSWHPSGAFITYSVNTVRQCFHSYRDEVRDHFDLNSHIVNYRVREQKTDVPPWSADAATMETWPCWSADGKCLYYAASPIPWKDDGVFPPLELEQVRYSLMRAAFDAATGAWGAPDTLLSGNVTGMSITMPRCSPDGRFLLFCMHDWGTSPHLRRNSDLWLMDLRTGAYAKPAINSEFAESWHSWSSNSRWIAFSSKRMGGVLTRIFLSYVDSTGVAHKPFVMPQPDPGFYESHSNVCNTPELVTESVTIRKQSLFDAAGSGKRGQIPVNAPSHGAPPVGSKGDFGE